ncbi:hypothetical protein E2C01_065073 [Portunus trituberculatus]|uniref:Uncharacterized protein n=1 Tax=Portunus trituberculatus TaxID=210409 RepID=A0A5B7HQR5_PORTR|nr:hypothetical protein [Portunus trituberculatus]
MHSVIIAVYEVLSKVRELCDELLNVKKSRVQDARHIPEEQLDYSLYHCSHDKHFSERANTIGSHHAAAHTVLLLRKGWRRLQV